MSGSAVRQEGGSDFWQSLKNRYPSSPRDRRDSSTSSDSAPHKGSPVPSESLSDVSDVASRQQMARGSLRRRRSGSGNSKAPLGVRRRGSGSSNGSAGAGSASSSSSGSSASSSPSAYRGAGSGIGGRPLQNGRKKRARNRDVAEPLVNTVSVPRPLSIPASVTGWDVEALMETSKKVALMMFSLTFIFLPVLSFAVTTFPLYVAASRVVLGRWTWCLRRQWLLFESMARVQGTLGLLLMSPIIYAYQSAILIFLMFDAIIFRTDKVKVPAPIFLTGCPRSGTTYLHRVLTKRVGDEGDVFAVHRLWEILFPSLILKTALKPFLVIFETVYGWFKVNDLLEGAYDATLNGEAHEEALMSMHALAGDFWVECHGVGFFWESMMLWLGKEDPDHWKVHTLFLKKLLQRQVYWTGKTQVLAKSPSLTWCLPELVEEFPDCKVLLLVRHPRDMLASNLSLMKKSWTSLYGENLMVHFWSVAAQHVIWRRHEQWTRCIKFLQRKGSALFVKEVRYERLKPELDAIVESCFQHCQASRSEEYHRYVQAEKERQATRQRSHKVKSLSQYRIPLEPVMQDFRFVCERYGYDADWD